MSTPTTGEVVALITAGLVAWNTWRSGQRDKVVKAIHTLTNSAMGEQLKVRVQFAEMIFVQAQRLASVTGEEGDKAAAIAAGVVVESQKAMLNDHLARQAKVDAAE